MDLDDLIKHAATSEPAALQCCCGLPDCAFMAHNCSVLDSVEKDVHTAATLGKALLVRYNASVADAERDRHELMARIEQLELDKQELEAENVRTVAENRALLDQLEHLNTTISDSDTRIKSLEATLHSSQLAVRRLEGAAQRAEDMEAHLSLLEQEQAALQRSLLDTESERRSAMSRWQKAERGITDLQTQLERMERDAKEERERHVEMMSRLDKQRAMEKELNTAAGRLKGAAATKSLQDPKTGSTVVSHFVRDLLQDNANLQLGLAELRELLMNSHDEIQMLREQLMLHQPVIEEVEDETSAASTLRAELDELIAPTPQSTPTRHPQHSPSLSQELHIHHHYHVANKGEKQRPRKKRQSLSPGVFTPPAAPSSPQWRNQQRSPAPLFRMHKPRDSASTGPSHRWSVFSEQPSDFASSVPSSPMSNPRHSMFDRGPADASFPGSPTTSVDPMSPAGWGVAHNRQPSDLSARGFSGFLPSSELAESCSDPQSNGLSDMHPLSKPIDPDGEDRDNGPEEHGHQDPPDLADDTEVTDDTVVADDTSHSPRIHTHPSQPPMIFPNIDAALHADESTAPCFSDTDTDTDTAYTPTGPSHRDSISAASIRPALHRAVSHESILSLAGGLDIHTLKARPSQMTLRHIGATTADTGLSAITALPTISISTTINNKRGSTVLRDNLSGVAGLGLPMPRTRIVTGPGTQTRSGLAAPTTQRAASGGGGLKFGRLVSWRPWGSGNTSPAQPTVSVTPPPPPVPAASVPTVTAAESRVSSSGSSTSTQVPSAPTPQHQSPRRSKTPTPRSAPMATTAVLSTSPVPGDISLRDMSRASGINQPGAIPGFYEYWAAHQRLRAPASKVLPDVVDQDALRAGLEGL